MRFVDTFYLLALFNRSDVAHLRAVHFAQGDSGVVFTTAWVIVEFLDARASPPKREKAANFLRRYRAKPQVRVIPPSEALLERSTTLYESRPDKEWSLTDCISFVVMHEEGLTEALTGDHHFEQAGFVALLK